MILYVDVNFVSPYAMSAHVALREKGLAFEVRPIDVYGGDQRTAAFGAVSRTRRVPTLVDGDFFLSESSAIAEYLDETCPGTALYPKDVKDRARAREVQAWLRSDLMPVREERSTEVVFLERSPPPLSTTAQGAADKLYEAAEKLLAPGASNLFGDWCIADTDLALMLTRLLRGGDAVPARLAAYARAQWQRPSVQEWVQIARPIC